MTPALPEPSPTLILTGPEGPSSLGHTRVIRGVLEAQGHTVRVLQPDDAFADPGTLPSPSAPRAFPCDVNLIDLRGLAWAKGHTPEAALSTLRQARLVLWIPASDALPLPGPIPPAPLDRAWLLTQGVAHSVLGDPDEERVRHLLANRLSRTPPSSSAPSRSPAWRHLCGRCGDPGCERQIFPRTR